ncbi:MAG: diguanylate cyclase [Gemmatimonadaceae bacterium]
MAIPMNVTIPKRGTNTQPDHVSLFGEALSDLRATTGALWTDHNVHDPGITTLELLSYALTDLAYRASFSVADLLATDGDDARLMKQQFFTAREILPNRPLTTNDYRKLLIDVEGVKNAWIRPVEEVYFADTIAGELKRVAPVGIPKVVPVSLQGLYGALIEYVDPATDQKTEILSAVRATLAANRNLCEEFVSVSEVGMQAFVFCAELELAPDANVATVHAQVLFLVQQYLSPPVRQYSLAEMQTRRHEDGAAYTIDEIFSGPALNHGFVDDGELAESELRVEIRLSDLIAIVMGVDGVRAVRDARINPAGAKQPPLDRWRVPVEAGKKATLDIEGSRLVSYKRGMPITVDDTDLVARVAELEREATVFDRVLSREDLPIPLGSNRNVSTYRSLQFDFPAVYGLGEAGLPARSSAQRQAQALQFQAYLAFFDQVIADSFAQLGGVGDLFAFRSVDDESGVLPANEPGTGPTYRHRRVEFRDWRSVYAAAATGAPGDAASNVDAALATLDDSDVLVNRRNRFLDHMIARVGERFHDFANIMRAEFGTTDEGIIEFKRAFLRDYERIGSERALAYNVSRTDPSDIWNSGNVSGFERRLARLLGIQNSDRRDLAGVIPVENESGEGMYVVENILLRPSAADDPFLPICVDPNCVDCAEDDPYSYRLHIILPAYGQRFKDMNFRQWAADVIREETPAHVQPKICWISEADMTELQTRYQDWITLRAGLDNTDRTKTLTDFISTLFRVKNVYPTQQLHECSAPEEQRKFILGQTALGTSH